MTKDTQIGIRLEPEQVELIDSLIEALAERGMLLEKPSRSAVVRTAMMRGLEQMRAELGADKPRGKAKR